VPVAKTNLIFAHMKSLLLLVCSLMIVIFCKAQSTAYGYFITLQGDTIQTNINLRKGVFGQISNEFRDEVEIIDSTNGNKKFGPADIRGYGLRLKGVQYRFVSKPTKKGVLKFLTPLYLGTQASLYYYSISTSGGGVTGNSQQTYYTFEKADGTMLFLRDILNNKFRDAVWNFFADKEAVQLLKETKLRYWLELRKDLLEIMILANS